MTTNFQLKKNLILIGVLLLCSFSIYYDLTTGTLPQVETPVAQGVPSPPTAAETQVVLPSYQEVIVDHGYTVLSIVEHLHNGPVPASIQQIIYDFEELNPGVQADEIVVGKTYLFPLYTN